jgi:hypothetical protein
MWNPFKKPATIETVTLVQHREVVAALKLEIARLAAGRDNAVSARNMERERAVTSGRLCTELLTERDDARFILRQIAMMETPTCAHIGRKMAAKAREGLPEFAAGEPVREVA